MPITYVDSTQIYSADFTDTTPITIPAPVGVADDDLILIHIAHRQGTAAVLVDVAGFTQLDHAEINGQWQYYIYWKKAASESGDYTATTDNTFSVRQASVQLITFRGVDTTTPFDVSFTQNVDNNNASPVPPAITTVTNGAMISTFLGTRTGSTATVNTTPSGYTMPESTTAAAFNIGSALSYKEQISFGLENIGNWAIVAADGTSGMYTTALRPAGGAGPAVPVLSNPTTPVYTP